MNKIMTAAYILLMAGAAWGQMEVATVTSSTTFNLGGATIAPGQGIPMWPVLAGDHVVAGTAMTILTFPDGSVITLDPGSEGKLDFVNGQPTFELLSGKSRYSLKRKGAVVVIFNGQPLALASLSGTLTMGGAVAGGAAAGAAAAGITAGHIAVIAIVGGAAAAGLGVGIARATGGGAAVSPSQ
jgi:hypothetical protein